MAEAQLDCPPLPKRAKRQCHFISKWVNEFQGNGRRYARCTYCASDGGRNVITAHVRGKHRQNMARACSSQSVTSFLRPQTPQSVIQAESLWSRFVAKHNISFQSHDHATKLFHSMFPDSEIALLVRAFAFFFSLSSESHNPKVTFLFKSVSHFISGLHLLYQVHACKSSQ